METQSIVRRFEVTPPCKRRAENSEHSCSSSVFGFVRMNVSADTLRETLSEIVQRLGSIPPLQSASKWI